MGDKVKPWHKSHRRKHKERPKKHRSAHKFRRLRREEEEDPLPVPSVIDASPFTE